MQVQIEVYTPVGYNSQYSVTLLMRTSNLLVSKSSRQSAASVKLRAPIGLDRIAGKIVIDWSYLLL